MPEYIIYYAPVAIFMLWALYSSRKLPSWRDTRFVRHPERNLWTIARVLNKHEWTEDGLKLRGRYIRHIFAGLAFAGLAALIVSLVVAAQQ